MLTLTYAKVEDWRPGQISDCLKSIREYLRRRRVTLRNVWVAELQRRGAVHYHVVIWLPLGMSLPKPDKRGWWRHGATRIEWARCGAAYISKYASKGEGAGAFPKGLRLSGFGGLERERRRLASWTLLPAYVRSASEPGERCSRARGGGYLIESTGELVLSPWVLVSRSCGVLHFRLREDVAPVVLTNDHEVGLG